MFRSIALLLLLALTPLSAYMVPTRCYTQQTYIGPEIYWLQRVKEGGSKQHGVLYGFRAGYERVKAWGFYYGIEGHYGHGRLKGATGGDEALNSNMEIGDVEGRLGYAMQFKCRTCPYILPFAGAGWISQTNRFFPPVTLPLRFRTRYEYAVVGLAFGGRLNSYWTLNAIGKILYPFNVWCEVTNDPSNDDRKMMVDERIQYALELPITYTLSRRCRYFAVTLAPFFRYRHFGGREAFPFDYVDTKIWISGARAQVEYRF